MIYFINIVIVLVIVVILARIFRKRIRRWLYKLQFKMKFLSVKSAIRAADADKEKTDRKNVVYFNTSTQQYEPIQKRLAKHFSKYGIVKDGVRIGAKRKSNAAKTKYRKRYQQGGGQRSVKIETVHLMEKKSLYVTK